MSKFTGVEGCAALASAVLLFMITPVAMEASIILRRVSIGVLPACSVWCFVGRAETDQLSSLRAGVLPMSAPDVVSPWPRAGDYRGKCGAGRAAPCWNRLAAIVCTG